MKRNDYDFDKLESDRMIDDPDNYIFGIFYYNPDDTRLRVPKMQRWRGWTINFGYFTNMFSKNTK